MPVWNAAVIMPKENIDAQKLWGDEIEHINNPKTWCDALHIIYFDALNMENRILSAIFWKYKHVNGISNTSNGEYFQAIRVARLP